MSRKGSRKKISTPLTPQKTEPKTGRPAPKAAKAALDYKKLWQNKKKKERQKRHRAKKGMEKKQSVTAEHESEKLLAMILEFFIFLGASRF